MENYVNIKVKPDTKKLFKELCKKYNQKQVVFAEQVFNYLHVTGYDPTDTQQTTPGEEIKKLRNTVVSFIRKQESDILKPMVNKIDDVVIALAQFIREEREDKYKLVIDESVETTEKPDKNQDKLNQLDELKINLEKKEKENVRLAETLHQLKDKVKLSGFTKTSYSLTLSKGEYNKLFL